MPRAPFVFAGHDEDVFQAESYVVPQLLRLLRGGGKGVGLQRGVGGILEVPLPHEPIEIPQRLAPEAGAEAGREIDKFNCFSIKLSDTTLALWREARCCSRSPWWWRWLSETLGTF